MIKLKNGKEIHYNQDFDEFFRELLETVIFESKNTIDIQKSAEKNVDLLNEAFLKELMDNCIYITRQLFDMGDDMKDLARFMVSGFIFNSLLLLIQTNTLIENEDMIEDQDGTVH